MRYCRWSSPVPEEVPDVDLSFSKLMEFYESEGHEGWMKYLRKNNVAHISM